MLWRESFLQRGVSQTRHDWQKLDVLVAERGDQECQDRCNKVFALLGFLPKEFQLERHGLYPGCRKTAKEFVINVLCAA